MNFLDYNKIVEEGRKAGHNVAMTHTTSTLVPEKGKHYTISPSLRNGDRSYTGNVLTVLATNEGHAKVDLNDSFWDKPVLILIAEHYWYDATEMMTPGEATE